MNIEMALTVLSAFVFAGAMSLAPLVGKCKHHFYDPEDETKQEWAYLIDAFFARALLTAILSTIVLFLGLTIAKGLTMKGVSEAVRAGFEDGSYVVTVAVLLVGGFGAAKQKLQASRLLKTRAIAPPERENLLIKLIIFVVVAALYIPAMQRGLAWLQG